MPNFLVYRTLPNPLAVTQSDTPVLSLKNYLIAIDVPGAAENELFQAHLTELTSITVMGQRAAKLFKVEDGDSLEINLISYEENHLFSVQTKVHVSDKTPADYISLGWSVLAEDFTIGPKETHGLLPLLAFDDRCKPAR